MAKIGFPMLIGCVIVGITAVGLATHASRAVRTNASVDTKTLMVALARHRLILVCPDAQVQSDLTYERALLPQRFSDSAIDAVNSDKCRLRQATADDFGQVMRQ